MTRPAPRLVNLSVYFVNLSLPAPTLVDSCAPRSCQPSHGRSSYSCEPICPPCGNQAFLCPTLYQLLWASLFSGQEMIGLLTQSTILVDLMLCHHVDPPSSNLAAVDYLPHPVGLLSQCRRNVSSTVQRKNRKFGYRLMA